MSTFRNLSNTNSFSKFAASSILLTFLSASSIAIMSACAVQNEVATNSTDTAGNTVDEAPTGEGVATSNYFEVTVVESPNYEVVMSKNGDGVTPCRVLASGEDITCVIDMNELDLWSRGYQINYTLPDDFCDFGVFNPYFYNVAPVGIKPTKVVYSLSGDILAAVDPNLVYTTGGDNVAASDDIFYLINNTWKTHSQLYGSKASGSDDVRCPWDYTNINEGRNCCAGTYKLKTVVDGETQSERVVDWGGSLGNCFEGPGMISDEVVKGENGLPAREYFNVDAGGYSNIFKMHWHYSTYSNLFGANYYISTDPNHASLGGGLPNIPKPTQISTAYAGYVTANYSVECMDSADEILARIRILVREWNQESEFDKFVAGVSSNPNTSGIESGPTQTAEDAAVAASEPADGPINDFSDWKDCDAGGCGAAAMTFGEFTALTAGYIMPFDAGYYIGFSTARDHSE